MLIPPFPTAVCFQSGPVAPFNASAVVLLLGGAGISVLWTENLRDIMHRHALYHQFEVAFAFIVSCELAANALCELAVIVLSELADLLFYVYRAPFAATHA